MSAAESERVVYYEDLAPAKSVKNNAESTTPAKAATAAVESSGNTGTKSVDTAKVGTKRQRTIGEMFGPSTTVAKKPKLGQSASFGSQPLNSIPFSLSGYLDSLNEEERDLLSLECETMGKSWLKVLTEEIKKPYFLALKRFLRDEGVRGAKNTPRSCKVYPPPKDIYSWSNYTPLGKVKVVIVGQDPYFSQGQAHGLCFSVPQGVAVPPSLINIYNEIKAEYPEFVPPKHGNLTLWATNGVLMLNTCLTVKAGNPGSHSNKGWETFTEHVLRVVDKYGGANLPKNENDASSRPGFGRGVVFVAWGSWAQKRVAGLDKNKHLILSSAHPSPRVTRGFLGNGHFKLANEWLEEKYGPAGKVDWCKLDETPVEAESIPAEPASSQS